MFDRIAPVYDAMNRVMTAGLDLRWRRLAATAVVRPGDLVLDAACGTGDFALADRRAGAAKVTGVDFSPRMLERARHKAPSLEWVEADLLALPFEDRSFDSATVGFGVRNVADLEGALVELRRVLRPGGAACDPSRSRSPAELLKPFLFAFWFDRLVPALGRLLPGGSAYTYLPASVARFPGAEGARRPHEPRRVRSGVEFRLPRRLDRRAAYWDAGRRRLDGAAGSGRCRLGRRRSGRLE